MQFSVRSGEIKIIFKFETDSLQMGSSEIVISRSRQILQNVNTVIYAGKGRWYTKRRRDDGWEELKHKFQSQMNWSSDPAIVSPKLCAPRPVFPPLCPSIPYV